MTVKNRTHYPHHDREHVYRVPDNEMPPVEETIDPPAPSVMVDDIWDLERRACAECATIIYSPTWSDIERTGHCKTCEKLVERYRVGD